jgi:Flp pilus assembly protein TadG
MFPVLKYVHTLFSLRSNRPNREAERGSAMLEAGLALPVLLLMALGAMDFARVFVAGIVVESAARAAVQLGALNVGKAGAETATNAAGTTDAANQGHSGVTVTSRTFCGCVESTSEVSCSTATCSGATPGGYVEATATYTFRPLVNYPGIPQNIPLTSKVRFRAQ